MIFLFMRHWANFILCHCGSLNYDLFFYTTQDYIIYFLSYICVRVCAKFQKADPFLFGKIYYNI